MFWSNFQYQFRNYLDSTSAFQVANKKALSDNRENFVLDIERKQ